MACWRVLACVLFAVPVLATPVLHREKGEGVGLRFPYRKFEWADGDKGQHGQLGDMPETQQKEEETVEVEQFTPQSHLYFPNMNPSLRPYTRTNQAYGETTGRGNDMPVYPTVLQPCPRNCSGHGECRMDQPEGQWFAIEAGLSLGSACLCEDGWTGVDCSIRFYSESFHHYCSGHGHLQESGSCVCLAGWSLSDCSYGPTSPCPQNCSGRGRCWENQCHCMPGFSGADCSSAQGLCPLNCTGRGVCGGEKTKQCLCEGDFTGPACNHGPLMPAGCARNCSGWGSCVNGSCECKTGFTGPSCELALPICHNNCSGHGICWTGASVCSCSSGFTGEDCSIGPHYGDYCPQNCTGHGDCVDGECFCYLGFEGPRCSSVVLTCLNSCSGHGICWEGNCICFDGFGGEDCGRGILGDSGCPANCSGHGICDPHTKHCRCEDGYGGDACSIALVDRACPANCSAHGYCNPLRQSCECHRGYQRDDCSVGYITQLCRANCSGHGECLLNCDKEGYCPTSKCRCFPPWRGEICDQLPTKSPSPSPSPSNSLSFCPFECSHRGECVALNSTLRGILRVNYNFTFPLDTLYGRQGNTSQFYGWGGFCDCNQCFQGYYCQDEDASCNIIEVSDSPSATISPTPSPSATPSLSLSPSPSVEMKPIPVPHEAAVSTVGACPYDCHGHGTCILGMCVCDQMPEERYSGIFCDKRAKRCPNDCAGRGKCDEDTGVCSCFNGWSGPSCEHKIEKCHWDCDSHGCVCVDKDGRPLIPQPPAPISPNMTAPEAEQRKVVNYRRHCEHGWCRIDYSAPVESDTPTPTPVAVDPEEVPVQEKGVSVGTTNNADAAAQVDQGDEQGANEMSVVPDSATSEEKEAEKAKSEAAAELVRKELIAPSESQQIQAAIENFCPEDCSGHGNCDSGICRCHESPAVRWTGPSCATPIYGCNTLDNCNAKAGRGKCNNGTCDCVKGWGGLMCEKPDLDCPRDCSKHGKCNRQLGVCECDESGGYHGDDCSIDKCLGPPCVWGFGRTDEGQLGLGDLAQRGEIRPAIIAQSVQAPRLVRRLDSHEIASVACGPTSCFGWSSDSSKLYAWGGNDYYQLGTGNADPASKPVPIPFFGTGQNIQIKQISAGARHTLAVTNDGQIYGWGTNTVELGSVTDFAVDKYGYAPAKFEPLDLVESSQSRSASEEPEMTAEDQSQILRQEAARVSQGAADITAKDAHSLAMSRSPRPDDEDELHKHFAEWPHSRNAEPEDRNAEFAAPAAAQRSHLVQEPFARTSGHGEASDMDSDSDDADAAAHAAQPKKKYDYTWHFDDPDADQFNHDDLSIPGLNSHDEPAHDKPVEEPAFLEVWETEDKHLDREFYNDFLLSRVWDRARLSSVLEEDLAFLEIWQVNHKGEVHKAMERTAYDPNITTIDFLHDETGEHVGIPVTNDDEQRYRSEMNAIVALMHQRQANQTAANITAVEHAATTANRSDDTAEGYLRVQSRRNQDEFVNRLDPEQLIQQAGGAGGSADSAGGDGAGAGGEDRGGDDGGSEAAAAEELPTRLTDGSKGTAKEDTVCVFPFTYKGKTYKDCTKDLDPDPSTKPEDDVQEWCCTIEKCGDTQDTNKWGTCRPKDWEPPASDEETAKQFVAETGGSDSVEQEIPKDVVPVPKLLLNLEFSTWEYVAAGDGYSAGITESGQLWTWGTGEHGRLGHGDVVDKPTPQQIVGKDHDLEVLEWSRVVLCPTHAAAIAAGKVYTWGNNNYGQLGHDTTTSEYNPKQVKWLDLKKVKDVACGDRHTLFLTTDGFMYSSGANDKGQLGLPGVPYNNFVPEPRMLRTPFVVNKRLRFEIKKISCGATHCVAQSQDGQLFAWGSNSFGELGINSWSTSESGRAVRSLGRQKPLALATGRQFTVIVTEKERTDQDAEALSQEIRAEEDRYLEVVRIQKWYANYRKGVISRAFADKMSWINKDQPLMYYPKYDCKGGNFQTTVASQTNFCSAKVKGKSLNDKVKSVFMGRFTLLRVREHCSGSSATIELVATQNQGGCHNLGSAGMGSFGSSYFLGWWRGEVDPFPLRLHADPTCSMELPKEKTVDPNCWSSLYANVFMENYAGGARRGYFSADAAKAACNEDDDCGGITMENNGQMTLRQGPRTMTSPNGEGTMVKGGCDANPKRITQIQFRTGGLTDLVLIHYDDGSSSGHGGYGGGWQPTFAMKKGEYVVEFKGKRSDRHLTCIQVVTNKGRISQVYGPCAGSDFSFRAADGEEIWDIVDAGGFCPPMVGMRTRAYKPPPGLDELGFEKILENAEYGGRFQNTYEPLKTGAFSEIVAVYKSGSGVWCNQGWGAMPESVDYVWMRCGPRFAFEFMVNDRYAIKQFAPLDLPHNCKRPDTPQGDIHCDAFVLIKPGDKVRPTWMEPSLGVSLGDNGGSIKVDIYGMPSKGHHNWATGYWLDLGKAYFQNAKMPIRGTLGSVALCPGCVGEVRGPGGFLAAVMAGDNKESCVVVEEPTVAWYAYFSYEGLIREGRPHAILFNTALEKGVRHIDAAVTPSQLPVKDITIEAWVRVSRYEYWGGVAGIMQDDGQEERGFLLGYNGLRPCFALATKRVGRLTYMCTSRSMARNVWYHLAATYDGRYMRLYVNGYLIRAGRYQSGDILYPPDAYKPKMGGNLFTIGAYHDANEYFPMVGFIADVRIWSIARSSRDIRKTMRKALTGREGGLLHNWGFFETKGSRSRNRKPGAPTATFRGKLSRTSVDKIIG